MNNTFKRFVSLCLAVLILLSVGQGLSLPHAEAATSDWETARAEWFLRICGDESNDVNNVYIRRLLDMLEFRGQSNLRKMDTGDTAKRLFYSGEANNVPITSTANMYGEYQALRQIALAYGTYGNKYYRDPEVEAKLLYGVKWLNEHYYGDKQTYGKGADGWHLMTGYNWWDWYIGVPRSLYDILIVLDHFDLLTDAMIDKYLAPVKYVLDDPDGMYRFFVDNDETYDHKVKHISTMLGYALLKEDSDMIKHLVNDVIFCMQPSETGNGIREDGSFRMHEYFAMEGTYGGDILIDRIIHTTALLHGTSFLDPISDAALNGQVDWFTEIFAPVMHNGVVMAQSNGRYPHNGISYGDHIIQGALALVDLYPAKEAELRRFILDQVGDYCLSAYDMIYYQRVLNKVQAETQPEEREEYARTRYITDRVVQHRKDYTVGLALSSNRTLRYECINDCNMKGWYTGDGMLYVYTGKTSQKFDEYGSEFFSNVNMHRLPGTTEDTAERKPVSVSSTYRHHMIPNESFVGGVQFDDDYATIAYDFAAYNSPGNENAAHTGYGGGNPAVTSDLKAKKSYFFFDNEVVCLGAAITSTNPTAIHTYVDNRQLTETTVLNGTAVYGTEDITVDGKRMDNSTAYTQSFTNPKSVFVEGFGGYYFPNGGNVTLNKTAGTVPFYELWLDHGLKPTNAKYSYVMLPTMSAEEVAAYAKLPEIEVVVNNEKHQVVHDTSSGITGLVFWKASTYNGITVDQPLTLMLREQDGVLKISVADPTQELTQATVTIHQRLYKLSCDADVTVTENDLSTQLVIDFASAGGKSVTAEFGQKSTQELLFSFTGTESEQQSNATATYGGNDFSKTASWQCNGTNSRPTIDTSNGGSLTVDLVQEKTYHWLQITEYGHNVYSNPLQYIPHADDVVQVRFKLENCTVTESSQLWFQYTGPEETTDSVTGGYLTKLPLPADCAAGEYMVMTFRNLPASYSALTLLSSFRLHFNNVTAGANAKIVFDTIYIGKEANAPANAPLYFSFDDSPAELYRYTDVSYGSGAYNFSDKTYWAKHSERTPSMNIENGILSFTVSTDETMGASSWLRPSNGRGSNTAHLLHQNPANIEVVQLRLRITGTLRSNSDLTVYLSKETGKFSTIAVAKRELLKTGEFYVLNMPVTGSTADGYYGLFTLDTHNMQGCTVELDYIYMGNRANAPRAEGLLMEFDNSMSDVYRYKLPQYLGNNYDDTYHWAANYDRSSRPVVNAQSGCLEYSLHHSQTWLRPSVGRNNSTSTTLDYTPSAEDVFQIHFRADGFTGKSGSLWVSFTDGTKQSNGWFVFQALTEGQTIHPTDGTFITLTLPLTDAAKAATLRGITIDYGNMAGCKLYIDSVYIGPADGAPCCTGAHKAECANAKAATCTEEGYSGDYVCTVCGHQTAKGQVVEKIAHKYSYTSLDYSHKAKCTVCGETQWEAHRYNSKGLCQCGAKEAAAPQDYLYIGFENNAEAQARYMSLPYCGYNYDTSTCWGYNSSRSTAPTVNEAEECLTFQPIGTSAWVRPTLSKRSVGTANLYYPTKNIQVFQMRLKLQRETANSNEGIDLGYTGGDHNATSGDPVYRNIKTFSAKVLNAIPNGEYATLTVALESFTWPWEVMRGFNLNFKNMQGATVAIDYIYFGSWENLPTCKDGHSYTAKVTTAPTFTAKGVKTYTCSKCTHTYTESVEPLHKSLYFDFDNSAVAQARYNNHVYNFRNFDQIGAWRGRTLGLVDGSASMDTKTGLLTVKPSVTGYGSIYADSVNFDLNYDPDHAEYFQIRFKMTGYTGASGKASIHFYYKEDNTYIAADAVVFPDPYLHSGEYYVATGKIQDEIRALEEIHRVIIHLSGFTKPTDLSGEVVFDYAFVGPYEELPNKEYLHFDFTNTKADQLRYNSRTYGFTQFDKAENWYYSTSVVSGIAVDHTAGTLTMNAKGTIADNIWPAVYTETVNVATGNKSPITFHPNGQDYFQIRFKMKNFRIGDQVVVNADGTKSTKTINPYLKLSIYADGATSAVAATADFAEFADRINSDTWFVATVPLKDVFKNAVEIERLRLYFGGIESISDTQAGMLTVDYMFVGKLSDLPTPAYTVTFKDAAGKVLATRLVNRGETATYTGKTPTKAADGTNHYTFKGWDKALTNIQADTVITATYTATAHSYSYTKADGTNHKATCSCGYSKNEAHSYTSKVTTAATCTKAGVKTYTCSKCAHSYTEAIAATGHTPVTDKAVAATCTTAGKTEGSHCSVCNAAIKAQETVPATGHSYTSKVTTAATCTTEGVKTYTCSKCSHSYTEAISATGHTPVTDKAIAATCTTDGKTEGSHCSVCNAVIKAQTTVPATGHSYTSKVTTAATCTTEGVKTYTCSKCNHSYTEAIAATGHTPVTDKAVAATCTTDGKTEGSHCSVCNAVIKAQETVPATGHSYTSKVTTAATCTKAGVKTFACSKCNHSYTEAIAATGHTPVTDKAVAATCTTAGKTEGSHCSVCNAVIKAQETVPATGHSYSSKVTTAATCTKAGVKTFTCSKCNHSYTEAIAAKGHTPVTDKAIAATCTTAGKTEGSHCSVCNAVIKAQTTIPATGHSYTSKVTTAATCTKAGVKTFTCSKCNHSYTEAIAATGHTPVTDKAVDATCTTAGKTEGSHCSVCNAVIKAQTSIPATGHSYTSKVTTAATCTKAGVKTFTCSKCNHSYTEAIAATGHTPVTDKAVAATCTTAGKTEGSHCSVCNAVIKAQTTVPALGHDYKYTDNGDGTHAGTCTRCEDVFTEGHKFEGETCFCGAKVLTVDESIKIYHTLDLASDISITFAVPQTALASYDSYYLEVVLPEYEGNEQTGTSTVQIQPVVNGKYYYFTLTGITAVRMGDLVDATLHMVRGTAQYISVVDSYSVATYAYGMLSSTTDAKMLTLCADLLRYGAEAQSFKGYRTDSLVDANLTEAQRAYLSNTENLTFTATDSYLNDLANPTLSWVGKTLDLGSKVGMKFVFNAKNYSGDIANLSMKVAYKGSNGETKTVTLTGAEVYNAKNSYYSFTFYGLLASELRTVVDVAVFDGNTQLTETLRYSAESYASKNTTGALGNLCKALFAYSDSAKAYFS